MKFVFNCKIFAAHDYVILFLIFFSSDILAEEKLTDLDRTIILKKMCNNL